ncbi:MAG: hypothetical protein U0P30_15295 [Vicinamibacterales bacterium]
MVDRGGVVAGIEEVDAFDRRQKRAQFLLPAARLLSHLLGRVGRMVSSSSSVPRPSIEVSSRPARCFFSSVATRTMKNSSRLVAEIERNFTRSSRGCEMSDACASTRRLNSSQLSSRLM